MKKRLKRWWPFFRRHRHPHWWRVVWGGEARYCRLCGEIWFLDQECLRLLGVVRWATCGLSYDDVKRLRLTRGHSAWYLPC